MKEWLKKSEILPCPFCGRDLSNYPTFMIIKPVRTDKYLFLKLKKGLIIGSDGGWNVHCVGCGIRGPASYYTKEEALKNWNRRNKINPVVDTKGHGRIDMEYDQQFLIENQQITFKAV